jgi:penicillin amidase
LKLGKKTRLTIGSIIIVVSLVISVFPLTLGSPYPYLFDPIKGLWDEPVRAVPPHNIEIPGLRHKVNVVVDKYGIPHIYADNEEDLFTAVGWVQAKYRLFEMDLMRRIVAGRLSELFGNQTLEQDKFMRNLQLYQSAADSIGLMKELSKIDPNVARALLMVEAFTRGVNSYIKWAEDHDALPVEYKLLGVNPEPWKPEDTSAVAKLIIYDLAYDDSDVGRFHLALANGLNVLTDFKMITQPYNEPIIHGAHFWDHASDFSGMQFKYNYTYIDPRSYHPHMFTRAFRGPVTTPNIAMVQPLNLSRTIDRLLGYTRCLGASNNWVVSGNITREHYPLLANDPHLTLMVPPIWIEMHLVSSDTGLNVYGVAFPGVPFIIIGRTLHAAWGFTDSFIDVVDWYYYKWNPQGEYYYKGQWLKPVEKVETILVKDGNNYRSVKITVKTTVHGPLFEKDYQGRKFLYAVQWTGLKPSLVPVWAYLMDHAEDVWGFLKAQQYFDAAIQNAVVADDKGNILYSPTGLIPVRDNIPILRKGNISIVNYGELPFNGSADEGRWIGYISFPYIPRLLNPSWGYVATANNRILKYGMFPWELQSYYCDHYRHYRIEELINKYKANGITVDEMMKMQKDIKSSAMADIVPVLVKLAEKDPSKLTSLDKKILSMLSQWNYVMDKDKPEPTIAFMWSLLVHYDTWKPMLTRASLDMDYCLVKAEFTSYALKQALNGNTEIEKYFENNAADFVIARLHNAEKLLGAYYKEQNDPGKWLWGKIHYYYFKHPMGSVLPWLNYPKEPASGGPFTINVAPQRPDNPYKGLPPVDHGPSIRFIAILNPEAPGAGYLMLPGGNDGNPFSQHYTDLYYQWVQLEYHEIRMDPTPDGLNNVEQTSIILEP